MPIAWTCTPGRFREQERAALALTESVALTGEDEVPDEARGRASKHFGGAGMARLLMATATINVWNRLAVSTRQDLPDLT